MKIFAFALILLALVVAPASASPVCSCGPDCCCGPDCDCPTVELLADGSYVLTMAPARCKSCSQPKSAPKPMACGCKSGLPQFRTPVRRTLRFLRFGRCR